MRRPAVAPVIYGAAAPGQHPGRARRLLGLLLAGGVIVTAAVDAGLHDHVEKAIDRRAFRLLGISEHSSVASHAHTLATIGAVLAAVVILAAIVVLAARRRWRTAAAVTAGFPLALLCGYAVKAVVQRPRPFPEVIPAGGFSFPSTDAAISIGFIAAAVGVAELLRRRSHRRAVVGLGVLAALLTSALLVALRVHYMTDVIAGWGVGTAAFAACGVVAGLWPGRARTAGSAG